MHRWVFGVVVGISGLLVGGCSQTASVSTEQHAVAAAGDTRQILLTQDWLFARGDPGNASAADFDDSSWRRLDLPHDWSIEGPIDRQWASGTGFFPAGIAWYRKHFSLLAEDAGKMIAVRFDGVYKDSTVYINGQKLGERPYGYISFEYNLTPYLNASGDNVLAVRVDHHNFADSRWYPGSGIYRNVYLIAADPVHVDRYGTFVKTVDVSKDSADVSIDVSVKNELPANVDTVGIVTTVFDPSGLPVAGATASHDAKAGGTFTVSQALKIPHPALWSVDSPVLYTAMTKIIEDGQTIDTYRTPFGIRTIKFDPASGFWLNGQSMKLKGVCLHEDAGALGSAIPRQVWERRLRILKEAGTNAIRCSHNPPAPEFLDLCDRLGFVVMDEAFDEWTQGKRKWIDRWNGKQFSTDGYHVDFEQWSDRDIADMVLRDRNHPSIVMWSIGNEIDYKNDPYPPNAPELPAIAARLIADVKALDTSRPVTAACASIATNLYYPLLDIAGYNYQEDRYAADHAATPSRVIYGSENKPSISAWRAVADNAYISAQFLWTGIDYLGEARAWPNHASPDGFLDLAAFPKPAFYDRKSLWNDAPMVKIIATPGGRLHCYTNGDSVEFTQNGKSFSTLPSLADGPIHAMASKNSKVIAEDTFTPPGPAAKIQLQEYKTTLGPGDGPNVAQIELAVTDNAGNVVPDAADDVSVTYAGPGRLLGIESGDTQSMENCQAPHHRAFHGRLLIYIETRGPVAVRASAAGLPAATIGVGN